MIDYNERLLELLDQRYEMMDKAKRLFFPDCEWKELTDGQINILNNICNDVRGALYDELSEEEHHHDH